MQKTKQLNLSLFETSKYIHFIVAFRLNDSCPCINPPPHYNVNINCIHWGLSQYYFCPSILNVHTFSNAKKNVVKMSMCQPMAAMKNVKFWYFQDKHCLFFKLSTVCTLHILFSLSMFIVHHLSEWNAFHICLLDEIGWDTL